MHNFTQTKTKTANQLVLYQCASQNELQQLQAYLVMYWECFGTAAFFLPIAFVLQELTNPTVCFFSFALLDVQSDYARTQCGCFRHKFNICVQNDCGVWDASKTVVKHTIFVVFTKYIEVSYYTQNILSVCFFLVFYVWIKASARHMQEYNPKFAINTEVWFSNILTAAPSLYLEPRIWTLPFCLLFGLTLQNQIEYKTNSNAIKTTI